MKCLKLLCALAVTLALLLALPALAEEAPAKDPHLNETSDPYCASEDSPDHTHKVADDAWVVSQAPSCQVGLRKGLCEYCGLTYLETIPATGEHVWNAGEVTTAPTCVNEGVKTYTCIMCGSATKTESIPATDEHTWDAGVETTAPTCVAEGVRTYTCTVCDATKTESIPATDEHTWDEGVETTAPTCTTAGVKTFTCTVCSDTKTEEIPALDHDFSVEVTAEVPATCTTPGTTAVMKCSRCDETEGGETIPATGHTVTTWELVEKPTCSAEGKEQGVCDVCGQTVEQAIPIDPVAHAFDNGVETPATCTVDGKVVYTCTLCNATQEVAIPATGHKPDAGKVTKEPTCTVDGVKTYTCTVCGKHLDEAIPAEGHDWGEWVTLRQATEEQNGEQERTCQVCGATQTREVQYKGDMPKTGVFTVPTAWLVAALALSLTGYAVLKRKSVRG